ncbi:MAG: hypothetical protein ACR5K4_00075 [Sodalis sp. (in: enterobacteria)]
MTEDEWKEVLGQHNSSYIILILIPNEEAGMDRFNNNVKSPIQRLIFLSAYAL